MKLVAFDTLARALHDARVQYLVVGGVAVNAHGYIRFTPDIDLTLELQPQNIRKAFQALEGIGFHPNTPIDATAFAGREHRPNGHDTSAGSFLTFEAHDGELTPVHLLTHVPFDFPLEYAQAMQAEILPGVDVRFLAIPALIRLKEQAGRLRDRDDIQHLRWLQEDYSHIDENDEDFLWSMASFDGARKMQLIRNKQLSIRKRLESLDDLSDVCEHLQKIRRGAVLRKLSAVEKERPKQ